MNIKSSTVAKDEFYDLLKQVNDKEEPIIISSSNNQRDAVIIGKNNGIASEKLCISNLQVQ